MSLVYIFIIWGLLSFVAYMFLRNPIKIKGEKGEARVHDILMELPSEYVVLDDVVLLTQNGTSQIDHIVVSKYGVFAVETKNYRGEIYGDDSRKEWTQKIVTRVRYRRKWYKTYTYVTKNQFYNPMKQAWGHVYVIKDKLKNWKHLPVVPIVCFVGDADISNIKSKCHVVDNYDLLDVIDEYQTVYLQDNEVMEIAQLLADYNMRDEVTNRAHIKNIKEAKKQLEKTIEAGICPKCGGQLVERNGKYGSFLGCSNYPKCRFIQS